jgi:DNA-binding response OmpR family regulator
MAPAGNSRLYRFGVHEADARSGELRKSGSKLKLQDQPFQVLSLLLERPGEVVRYPVARRLKTSKEVLCQSQAPPGE